MTREYLRAFEPKYIRDTLNDAIAKADEYRELEGELIDVLYGIDQRRLFIKYGYKSLKGFCTSGLQLTEVQAQRIVTRVRRKKTDEIDLKGFKINIGSQKIDTSQTEFNISPHNQPIKL